MDVDYSVELGASDDVLELPWASADGTLRYYDLRQHPELLAQVSEAQFPEIRDFLQTANSAGSIFLTAKCDVWVETELSEADEIYDAALKVGSYIDLVLADDSADSRFDFQRHERLAERLTELLGRAPQMSAAAEFIIRRCYFHEAEGQSRPGFYMTFYLFGYGEDEPQARMRWGIGLNLVQNAVLQLSAEVRRSEL